MNVPYLKMCDIPGKDLKKMVMVCLRYDYNFHQDRLGKWLLKVHKVHVTLYIDKSGIEFKSITLVETKSLADCFCVP
jgi:hypothetical protein